MSFLVQGEGLYILLCFNSKHTEILIAQTGIKFCFWPTCRLCRVIPPASSPVNGVGGLLINVKVVRSTVWEFNIFLFEASLQDINYTKQVL